ncbi:MAG: NAD(P)H-dependent oxidoreductase subunit E [Gaiella sp.]
MLEVHGHDAGRLLPILHDVQARLGHVPRGSVRQLARALGRSRAEIHGVVGFYHDLRWEPAGRRTLRLYVAESCQAAGVRDLVPLVEELVGCRLGETTEDGAVTLEPAYCLGLCTCSPAAALDDGTVVGRLDGERVRELVAVARAEP